jgi:diguanylate cyclase (GGDEF)-like protein/PAS domain S-box-containing protein
MLQWRGMWLAVQGEMESAARQLTRWVARGRGPGPASAGLGLAIVLASPIAFGDLLGTVAARWVIDWVQVLSVVLAFGFIVRVSRLAALSSAQRRAFGWLAVALLVLLVADGAWAWVAAVRREDPSFSALNWLYLPFHPLFLLGVLAFPRIFRSPADRMRFVLDALIVALGVALLLWDQVVQPQLSSLDLQTDALTLFILVGQPLLDCLSVLTVAVLLLRLPAGPSRQPMVWLALALSLNLVGDLVLAWQAAHAAFPTGGIADLLWIASRWCFLAAAESQLRVHRAACEGIPDEDWSPSFQLLPYLGVVVGYATMLYDALDGGVSTANLVGIFLLTLLVLLRQAVDRRETERLFADRTRQRADAKLAALVEHASEAILVLDAHRQITYASPAAARLFDSAPAQLEGVSFGRYLHPDESLAAASLLQDGAHPGPVRQMSLRLRRGDGWIWGECVVTDLLDRPEVDGIVLNVRDVTAQRELEEQLRHQSFHDPLTGLINRLLFGERISEALTERRPGGTEMAVMFVDLDHFKVINDSLGHGSGDAVIGQAAKRLEGAIRGRDVLARLGGDEFAVLLQDVDSDDEVVEAARRVMEAFRPPFRIGAREVALSASLGIAWASDTDTVDVLMRNADLALNEAKARGRDRFHVFQPDLHAAVFRKLQLDGAMRGLLEREGFRLAYQPIFRLEDLALVGVEALLRLPGDIAALATPAEAVAAAEDSGLIVPLGRWVLEHALHEMRRLQDEDPAAEGLRLTVNVSARQLHDPELPRTVTEALQRCGIAPARLVLELTETALADRPDDARLALERLKAIGVKLAIDDFGTGYSSLAQLARFPFDLLKVAKPFVDMIGGEREAEGERLARAVLALGASLHLETIAEGIERAEQLSLLHHAGCDLAQGFLLATPMERGELQHWLHARSRI